MHTVLKNCKGKSSHFAKRGLEELWWETEGVENLEQGMENLLEMMTYTCNPSAQETATEASPV